MTLIKRNLSISSSLITLKKSNINSELKKYQALNDKVINPVNTLINTFKVEDLKNANNQINENITKLGSILINHYNFSNANIKNFQYNINTFNNFRNLLHNILDAILLAIRNNELLISVNEKLDNANSILNDSEKLIEYFNSRYKNIFNTISQTSSNVSGLELKQEYAIYLELYGVPENLIFDSEKISEILLKIDAGIY